MENGVTHASLVIENRRAFEVTALTGAYHFATKPDFTPHFECYDFSQIMLILAGTGRLLTEDGQEHAFRPGMMLYRPAYRRSLYEWDGEKAGLAIIDFVCRSPAMESIPAVPTPLPREESAAFFDLVRVAARACVPKSPAPDAVFSYLCASLERFLSMVHCRLFGIDLLGGEPYAPRPSQEESRFIGEVKAFLAEHLSEQLTVGDLCARFWVGQTALMRKFKSETGRSPMEYFTGMKIAEARRRIADGTATFTELAEELGFSSIHYFSKVFKQKTGMTLTEYSRLAGRRITEG